MNKGRAIALIQQVMGFRSGLDATIDTNLDDAQEQIETNWVWGDLPWFMLSERSVASAIGEEERLTVPTDFVQEYEEDGLWLQLTNGGERILHKYDTDDLREAYQQSTNYGELQPVPVESPRWYSLTGDYFRLFPKPPTTVQVKMMYYRRLALAVGTTGTNAWYRESPKILMGIAGEQVSAGARDEKAYAIFSQWKTGAIEALMLRIMERKLANRRMAMGETN